MEFDDENSGLLFVFLAVVSTVYSYVKLGKGLEAWLAVQWASDVHKRRFYGADIPRKEVCMKRKSNPRMLADVML